MNRLTAVRRPRRLAWLVYAVIVTALLSTTTLSRYMTTVAGTGTATVARFEFHGAIGALSDVPIDVSGLKPNGTATTTFTVVNFSGANVSDVDQEYNITISTTGNLPLSYSLQLDSITGASGPTNKGVYGTLNTFYDLTTGAAVDGGVLPHSTAVTHTYTLKVHWPSAATSYTLATEIDAVTLTVRSEQVTPTP